MDTTNTEMTMPNMNINLTTTESEIVKSEEIVGYYKEIMEDIREDRKEIDEVLKNFIEMVTNEGDATTSSKEALVNLLKLKSESSDRKTRLTDLLVRAFLKEKDNFPRYLAAKQENTINITSEKRNLIKSIGKNA